MNDDIVLKALKCPYKQVLLFSLSCVNLTDKERNIIDYVGLRGYTEEEASEELQNKYKRGYSVNSIHTHKKRALQKIGKVWEKMNIIELLKYD